MAGNVEAEEEEEEEEEEKDEYSIQEEEEKDRQRRRRKDEEFDEIFDKTLRDTRLFLLSLQSNSPSFASSSSFSSSSTADCLSSLSSSSSLPPNADVLFQEKLKTLRQLAETLSNIRRGEGGDEESSLERKRKLQDVTLRRVEEQVVEEYKKFSATTLQVKDRRSRFSFKRKPTTTHRQKGRKEEEEEEKKKEDKEEEEEEESRSQKGRERDDREQDEDKEKEEKERKKEEEEFSSTGVNGKDAILIKDLRNQTLVYGSGDCKGKELLLRDLVDCLVLVSEALPAARLANLRRCLLIFSEVKSSVWIFGCSSCLFSFKTQQLRVHDSQDVAFLLQISSSPIIERSTEAVFAPHLIKLRETYSSSSSCLTKEKEKEDHDREGQEKDRDNGGEENKRYVVQRTEEGEEEKKKGGSVNRWNDVKDFDWIKRQASPNWRGVLSLSSLPLRNFPTFFIHLEKKTNADIKKKTESEEESRDKEEEGKLSTASERSESLSISSSSSSSASPPLGGYKETACSNDSPSSSFLPSSVWSISSPSSSTFSSSSSLSSFFSYLFASSSSSSPSLNCETFNACQDEGAVIIVDRHFLDTLLRHVGLAGRLADCLAELSLCLGEKQRKYKNEEKEEEKGKKRHDVFTESKEDEKEEEEKISWCSASKPRISPKGDASRRREGPVAKQEGDEEEEEI